VAQRDMKAALVAAHRELQLTASTVSGLSL
jgi:hypothetical protein